MKRLALLIAALVLLGGPAWGASCANCEDTGTGSCVCEDFEARDPNVAGDSPYIYLKECLTGSTPVVAAPPSGGLCWMIDTDCTTGSYQWTWRCPDGDYQLNSFVSTVIDAEGFPAPGWPHRELQGSEDFVLDSPLTGRVRLSIAGGFQVAITETALAGAPVCLSTAAGVDCDSDNVWNIQYALGGELRRDGLKATLQAPVLLQGPYAVSTAAKRYLRFQPVSAGVSATAADMETDAAARCLIRRATISLSDGSTGAPTVLGGSGGPLKVGVRSGGVDTELCSVATSASKATCGALAVEVADAAAAAWYVDCPSCTEVATRTVTLALGCQ